MGRLEELRGKQKKWEDLITSTQQIKDEILDLMRRAREELNSLPALAQRYPGSANIATRDEECRSFLKESADTLAEVEQLLSEFNQEKKAHQQLIKQVEKDELHKSANFAQESTGLTP